MPADNVREMKTATKVSFALMLAAQALLWAAEVYWWTTPTNVLEKRGQGDLPLAMLIGGSGVAFALAIVGIAKRRDAPLPLLLIQQASSWPLAALPLIVLVLAVVAVLSGA